MRSTHNLKKKGPGRNTLNPQKVLDARDPMGCRPLEVENYIQADPNPEN